MEVEACKAKEYDAEDGKPFEVVVVLGCAACEDVDDALVKRLDGDEMWRLRRVRRTEHGEG